MSDIPNKLRFCCLPVLPTIFSDELSYLDVLSKMRNYINQMIDAIKQQDEDIAKIQEQVDKVDPNNYIHTSGGTLTGPLFFIDNAHVLKNEDGTITLSGTGPMNLHGDGNVTIDTPESIAIRADKHVDITGSGGVEILASENGAVNIEGGAVAMTGNININGPTTFDKVDVDMLNARTKVAEPVEDENPATKKYVDGVTCGYITVAVDDTKNTVDVHSENLIPKGVLGGYYVDNAGNLWHATQAVASGFTLENQNINVLANAEFVRTTGNTSVKNINVNDTGSSTYQATTNVLVQGGAHVDISAGSGVEILASENGAVNIEGGAVAITGDINIHGPTTFDKEDVDMRNAKTKVAEPVEDENPATKKYVDGVTCGYITVAVDDTKNTVDVHSENLIPRGVLGGYYVDNAGNLWHATKAVIGGFTLENQNINVLANAEFVKITGNTSVKNINVNDTGSSTYQATTNVLVHGGTDVDITAGKGTVDVEAPIVDIHAARRVNIDTGDGGSVVIGGAKSAVDMGNAVGVIVPTPLKGIEAANKDYVDNLIGLRMKMLKRITAQAPYLGIPGDDFANYTEANIFIQASPDSTANEVWIGTLLLQGGSVTDCYVISIDATTGTQQRIDPARFAVTSSGIIIQGLSLSAGRGCYFVIPS